MADQVQDLFENLYQKRKKIQPRHISGPFQRLRVLLIWITLGIFTIGPWITWRGRQAVLFDIPQRKFYIFDITFWPQDLFLFTWLLLIAALTLMFVTNIAGRLWCGYTCPQTVWTKFYLWIERLTEGTHLQRLKLDRSPWNANKIIRRSSKHVLWLLLAGLTAYTFVGYFTPIRDLAGRLVGFQLGGWEVFWISFFTLATYLNAGWMREQVCMYICPYARFQSVMLDQDSMIITYDAERGEPRGARKRNLALDTLDLGACIDCKLCVQVCPTGIDIREGLQIECIGCACCIDACNTIMDKMNYPRNLIRYSTENTVNHKKTKIFRPRMVANGLVLFAMLAAFSYTLLGRVPIRTDVIKDRNSLYKISPNGDVENRYQLKILNMTQESKHYRIEVTGLPGVQYSGQKVIALNGEQTTLVPIVLSVPQQHALAQSTKIEFVIKELDNEEHVARQEARFIAPIGR